jgi:hypothetical protein
LSALELKGIAQRFCDASADPAALGRLRAHIETPTPQSKLAEK